MFKNNSIINDIKSFCNGLDKEYGSGKNNKKDSIIGFLVFLCVFIYSSFMSYNSLNKILILIPFIYLMVITFTTLLIIIFECLYYSPKNNIENKKKKIFLKNLFRSTFLLFCVITSPVLISISIFDKISELLGIQIFTRNIHIILLDLLVYIFAYLSCVGNYGIYELNLMKYFYFVSFVWIITYILRKTIYKINKFFSFREKYEYLYKSRSALIYIINILTIFSSVCGLYISKYNDGKFSSVIIFYIMPIIIFAGIEQIILCVKQNKSKRILFIKNLYEELVILHDIAFPQIINFSCMKIRIKISIRPYEIETYKSHFFSNKKKKDKIIIETLNSCKRMMEKEYNTYLDEGKQNFEKDLFKNIDSLAECLTIL